MLTSKIDETPANSSIIAATACSGGSNAMDSCSPHFTLGGREGGEKERRKEGGWWCLPRCYAVASPGRRFRSRRSEYSAGEEEKD
jgi:hypothetical protein